MWGRQGREDILHQVGLEDVDVLGGPVASGPAEQLTDAASTTVGNSHQSFE